MLELPIGHTSHVLFVVGFFSIFG